MLSPKETPMSSNSRRQSSELTLDYRRISGGLRKASIPQELAKLVSIHQQGSFPLAVAEGTSSWLWRLSAY